MKVYFTASARGRSKFSSFYDQIYKQLGKLGHNNLDNLITGVDEDAFYDGDHKERVELYKKAMQIIKKADVVVLEVSEHSLSMGFLIQKSLESGKPVVALHLKGYDPYFLTGIENDKLQVVEYNESDIDQVLKYSLDFASDQQDTRFNFFISPKHQNYLDWISKTKKIPRSVYLRNLIEKDIEKQEDYS